MNLIQSKRQPPNLKKLLIKAEYGEVLYGTFNCSDKRCECGNYLLTNDHYTFKNVEITSKLKTASDAMALTSHMSSSMINVRRNTLERQGEEKIN